jgi:hypothetical protein
MNNELVQIIEITTRQINENKQLIQQLKTEIQFYRKQQSRIHQMMSDAQSKKQALINLLSNRYSETNEKILREMEQI